jgi:hypothetical protein
MRMRRTAATGMQREAEIQLNSEQTGIHGGIIGFMKEAVR